MSTHRQQSQGKASSVVRVEVPRRASQRSQLFNVSSKQFGQCGFARKRRRQRRRKRLKCRRDHRGRGHIAAVRRRRIRVCSSKYACTSDVRACGRDERRRDVAFARSIFLGCRLLRSRPVFSSERFVTLILFAETLPSDSEVRKKSLYSRTSRLRVKRVGSSIEEQIRTFLMYISSTCTQQWPSLCAEKFEKCRNC